MPVVEQVALTLFDSKSRLADLKRRSLRKIPTMLTQANRIRGREGFVKKWNLKKEEIAHPS